jgi:hypothetical protein
MGENKVLEGSTFFKVPAAAVKAPEVKVPVVASVHAPGKCPTCGRDKVNS